jgi:hypothetical protein
VGNLKGKTKMVIPLSPVPNTSNSSLTTLTKEVKNSDIEGMLVD